ncbi:hypothetical protein B0H11DRAFT_2012455 [Mycena galericulata]|nr:hypothetical protein B0H11DRAFT_2012455 [Mycena galericulata]
MRSKWQKMEDVLANYGFDGLGEFLETLFYIHSPGPDTDPRKVVTSFLQGSSNVKMADILSLIHNHPQS